MRQLFVKFLVPKVRSRLVRVGALLAVVTAIAVTAFPAASAAARANILNPVSPQAECSRGFSTPPDWNTQRVGGVTPGVEPLNVIISACSDVTLDAIYGAMSADWNSHCTWPFIVSVEKANLTKSGFEDQKQAWRQGKGKSPCLNGNTLSLDGLENHVRLWDQPDSASAVGKAWFMTASYETLCVELHGKLKPARAPDGTYRVGKPWHCIDGGPGSYLTDGYNRGSLDFAKEIVEAAEGKGWYATRQTYTSRGGTGEDGVKFGDQVQVVTVEHRPPPAKVTEIPVGGIGLPPSGGTSPLVAGPDGLLWMAAQSCKNSDYCLAAVNPATNAAHRYPLPSKYSLYGAIASDNSGHLWLTANDGKDDLLRYTVSTGAVAAFTLPKGCQNFDQSDVLNGQLTTASDGYVWMFCFTANEQLVRVAPDGKMTVIKISYDNIGTAPVPGTGGVVWSAAPACFTCSSGVTNITPDGRQTFYPDPPNDATQAVVGNGANDIVDIATCGVKACYEGVSADGSFSQIATAPLYDTVDPLYYAGAGMDQNGDVWQLVYSTATKAAPAGLYYLRVTSAGDQTLYPLKLQYQFTPTGPLVITPDGSVWCEESGSGAILRFTP